MRVPCSRKDEWCALGRVLWFGFWEITSSPSLKAQLALIAAGCCIARQ
jgi:hypothetical protein